LAQSPCRTSTTTGQPARAPASARSQPRASSPGLNDHGNWASSAPSRPASASVSSPSVTILTSSLVHGPVRSCVNRCHSFTANRNDSFGATRRTHDAYVFRGCGR